MKKNILIKGSWEIPRAEKYLHETVFPIRLSVLSPDDFPIVMSLWYLYENKKFWCAVQKDSTICEYIKNNNKCGFEIGPNKPPYMGVRGRGTVSIIPEKGIEMLDRLIDRFLDSSNQELINWLRDRAENEVALCIEPVCFFTWDYSNRMN